MNDTITFNAYSSRNSIFTEEAVAGMVGQPTIFAGKAARITAATLNDDGSIRMSIQLVKPEGE